MQSDMTKASNQDRFLGVKGASNLISGPDLAAAIGLQAGEAIYSGSGWLHFETREGKTLYVARQPFRRALSWYAINACGAVDGTSEIQLTDRRRFKVRLLAGGGSNPFQGVPGTEPQGTEDSEWDRLIRMVRTVSDTEVCPVPITEVSLCLDIATWCQEVGKLSGEMRVYRGGHTPDILAVSPAHTTNRLYGWRPVLELIGSGRL